MLKYTLPGLAIASVLGSAANAEPEFYPMLSYSDCGKSEAIINAYLHTYKETPYFSGVGYLTVDANTTKTGFLVIASNLDTGSFSIIINFADGTSCAVVSGLEFQPFELPEK